MAGPSIDDLLRAADKGQAVGTTQRYFKTEPKGSASPGPAPGAPEPLVKPGETEKEMMDRLLGRSKTSMSDIDEPERAGQQYASAGRVTPEAAVPATRTYTLSRGGKTVKITSPTELQPAELALIDAQHFGAAAPLTKETAKEKQPSFLSLMAKNIAKIPERAAADVKGAVETFKNPSMTATLPLVVPGAGVATRLGTVAMGRMMDKPSTDWKENLGTALRAAGLGGIAEAILGGAAKVPIPKVGSLSSLAEKFGAEKAEAAAEMAKRTAGYKFATEAPAKAMDALKDRILGAKVIIPSIDPAKKITLEEAAKELATREGPAYQQTLAEIVNVLGRVDKQRLMGGPRPWAGQEFKRRVSPERFPPVPVPVPSGSTMERFAEQVAVPALKSPAGRLAADVGSSEEVPGTGIPAGALVGLGLAEGAGGAADLAKRFVPHMVAH